MAVLIDSPKGKGYTACCHGFTPNYNPYHSIDTMSQWYEWHDGWSQAYGEGRFGIDAGS